MKPTRKNILTRFKETVSNNDQSRTYAQWLNESIDEALMREDYEWAIRLTDILFRYQKKTAK